MKKLALILGLTVLSISSISCQKDEDCDTCGTAIENASGEWKSDGLQLDLSGLITVTDCFKKGSFSLKSDGTFIRTTYTNDEDCVIDEARTGSGTYEFIDNAEFNLYYNGSTTPVRVDLIAKTGGELEIVERPNLTSSSFVAIYHYKR